jgi:chemotaxis-related protein WspB
MLFLLFQLGKDRYALDTACLVEVLPMVKLKELPQASVGVIGAFIYHGAPVPLIDLASLALGKPSRLLMSTRIFLVNYLEPAGASHLLGLVAEQATETIRRDANDFVDAGVALDSAPYLGPVTTDSRGMIQRIEINRLLPSHIRQQLFRQPVEFS